MLQQHDPDAKKEIVMLLSNLSATCSKLRHGKDALEFANKCLKLDPEFVKVCCNYSVVVSIVVRYCR